MNNTLYLITYTYDGENNVEGYVNSYTDFKKWLKRHNKKRKEDGEMIECEAEEIELVKKLPNFDKDVFFEISGFMIE